MNTRLQNIKTVNFITLPKETWDNASKIKELAKSLETADQIITEKGIHPRIKWKSGYHDILTWHCKNPQKSKVIVDAFDDAFSDMAEGYEKEQIRRFISKNHVFIGKLLTDFEFHNLGIEITVEFIDRFRKFQRRVRDGIYQLYNTQEGRPSDSKFNITVLTCNAGNGHKAVAGAIEKFINTGSLNENFRAKVINIDEIGEDNISLVTQGTVKTYEIFTKFRCQENDHEKADAFCDLRWVLNQFIPVSSSHDTALKLQEIRSHIVINTIHHETEWLALLSDLGLPIRYINTDYSIPEQLLALKTTTNTPLFKILTPIDYGLDDPCVIPTGYPIRSGFEQVISEIDKANIKEKYGVHPGESLVVIQMGGLAMGIEKEVEKLIQETQGLKNRCHVVFLCANNTKAKDAILEKQRVNTNFQLVLHPEGMLNDVEMAKLYGTAHAILGKSGGATTAEVIAVKDAYLLVLNPLPWEKPNLNHLQKLEKGEEINNYIDLKNFLNTPKKTISDQNNQPLRWQESLANEINSLALRILWDLSGFQVQRPFSVENNFLSTLLQVTPHFIHPLIKSEQAQQLVSALTHPAKNIFKKIKRLSTNINFPKKIKLN